MGSNSSTFEKSRAEMNVFEALLKARSKFGGKREVILDADDRVLTYDELVLASFALGSALKQSAGSGKSVGVMLPTGAGSIISFFALSAYGRVPAMLNFTSGIRNLRGAIRAGQITHVVTAHKFIELAELGGLVEALQDDVTFIYLEDVRENLKPVDKIRGAIGTVAPWLIRSKPSPDATCVILFTSGTEGDPKGVALSHTNIVSNVQQVVAHVSDILTPDQIIFNPLPTFHCFGLTAGAILPILSGIKTVLYPSPLHVKEIPKRIAETGATILFATDTFISQYVRASGGDDLKGLQYAVCGAERVKDETRQLVSRVSGVVIIEGYGVTEASPVVAVNQPARNRPGTVGTPLAGVELDFRPVEGIRDAGCLLIRGPNIMKGYILGEEPGRVQPLKDGWHDTGDVVGKDEEGCLVVKGRIKRFAKLGGEMVSLTVVENCASAVWPDHNHAAAVLPDKRKGEQIILLSTNPNADRADMSHWIQNHGVTELSIPRRIFYVEEIPLLGSGKMDIGSVQRIAADLLRKLTPTPSM